MFYASSTYNEICIMGGSCGRITQGHVDIIDGTSPVACELIRNSRRNGLGHRAVAASSRRTPNHSGLLFEGLWTWSQRDFQRSIAREDLPQLLQLPLFVEEASGGDGAGSAGGDGFGDVDDGVVGEFGDLAGVVEVVVFAEGEAAVEDDVAVWV